MRVVVLAVSGLAGLSLRGQSTMTFDTVAAGTPLPFNGVYAQNGLVARSRSNNSQIGNPLNAGAGNNFLYFHGANEYVEFSLASGASFNLTSLKLVTNGFSARWISTSNSASQLPLGAPTSVSTLQFSGPPYENIAWFRVGTPSFATQVDDITVIPFVPAAPAIVTQPAGQTIAAGNDLTLNVTASGSPAPTYQWYKDGGAIIGATAATLSLPEVTTAASGAYSVIAANSAGIATSNQANVTVTTPVPVTPPSGIIAWLPLDETTGVQAADRMGRYPAAYANGPTPASGRVRGGLRFNGANYLNIQDSDDWAFGSKDFSIEFWVNFDAAPGGSIGHPSDIFIGNDEGPGSVRKWFFALGGGVLNFHINSPAIGAKFFPQVPFAPVVGRWYHLALVRSGSLYTIFVNGTPLGSAVNADPVPNPAAPLTVGQAEQIGFTRSRMDELTIYSGALSDEEIRAIYDAGSAGKQTTLAVLPAKGGNSGLVSLRISGPNLAPAAQAKLSKAGQADITAQVAVTSADGLSLEALFDLSGATLGEWDLSVQAAGGGWSILASGFTIEQGAGGSTVENMDLGYIQSHLKTSITGLGVIRVGRPMDYFVSVSNTGNIDASDVSVVIGVPKTAHATIQSGQTNTLFAYDPTMASISADPDFSFIKLHLGPVGASDTVLVPVSLRLNDASVPSLLSYAFDFEPVYAGSTTPAQAGGPTLADMATAKLVVFDGRHEPGSGPGGSYAGGSWTHPFLVIGNYVYTLNHGTLEQWTVADFNKFKTDLQNGNRWPGSTPPAPLLSAYAFRDVPITPALFPNLNPTGLLAALAANVGVPTKGDCIDTINNVTASSGLDLIPASTTASATNKLWKGDALWTRLGIDPYSTIGAGGPNARKKPVPPINPFDLLAQAVRSAFNFILKTLNVVGSFDPNEISGPDGYGPERYLSPTAPLPYVIEFENLPTATAPAQEVVVVNRLNPLLWDLSTLRFGPVAFGTHLFTPPPGAQQFSTLVDLRPTKNLLVNVTAGVNPNDGTVTWHFTSLDPATGNLPVDPLAGFLPPATSPPEGKGLVSYTVNPVTGLPTNTVLPNQAGIVFDTNLPILTALWSNKLDSSKPVSSVTALPASQAEQTFTLNWNAVDQGAGVDTFSIYVSDNGSPFAALISSTSLTTTTFTGTPGHTYGFYSVATDHAGNTEQNRNAADTSTTVEAGSSDVTAQLQLTPGIPVLNRVTLRYAQAIKVKNVGSQPVAAPLSLVFDQLGSNATLVLPAGTTNATTPRNSPYVNVDVGADGVLTPGETVTRVVEFSNPSNQPIIHQLRVLAGNGPR